MIVDVKDLQVGDDLLVGSNSHFRWMKVVRPIKLNKMGKYSAVRCSTKVNITQVPVYGWQNGGAKPIKYKDKKVYEVTGEGHNTEMYVDFNYKSAWLLARNGQKV